MTAPLIKEIISVVFFVFDTLNLSHRFPSDNFCTMFRFGPWFLESHNVQFIVVNQGNIEVEEQVF